MSRFLDDELNRLKKDAKKAEEEMRKRNLMITLNSMLESPSTVNNGEDGFYGVPDSQGILDELKKGYHNAEDLLKIQMAKEAGSLVDRLHLDRESSQASVAEYRRWCDFIKKTGYGDDNDSRRAIQFGNELRECLFKTRVQKRIVNEKGGSITDNPFMYAMSKHSLVSITMAEYILCETLIMLLKDLNIYEDYIKWMGKI